MKVVYPICCGVDVHKTFLVATCVCQLKKGPFDYEKGDHPAQKNNLHNFMNVIIGKLPLS